MDERHRELTVEAIEEAYKERVRLLYNHFDDALVAAEDDQDVQVAEERLRLGLDKAVTAATRIRAIAGVDG